MIKTYSEMLTYQTFEDRFNYLKLDGHIGIDTFGFDRYLNQTFYKSQEWKRFRRDIIVRDNGCDLAFEEYEIYGIILIHHLNPITKEDILNRSSCLMDPENVVCVSKRIHNAIHYGDEKQLYSGPTIRRPNDTCPWKGGNY